MRVYTVHAPAADELGAREASDRTIFVRDAFSFPAFVFGPAWLIWHRLWLALLGYVAVWLVLTLSLSLVNAGSLVRTVAMLVLALLMGFEGASLRRWTLARRGWRVRDVVVADDMEAAERRFFDRAGLRDPQPGVSGAPPPAGHPSPGQSYTGLAAPQRDIVGLFPQTGMPR